MLNSVAVLIIVPIAVHCAVYCGQPNPCNPLELQGLFEDTHGFPDEEVFKKYCRPSLDYLTCRKRYYSTCPEPDPFGINESTYDDIFELTSLLCGESSDLRKSYVENVDCYNEASEIVPECVENITVFEMSFRKTVRHQVDEAGATPTAVTCMLLPSLKNCTVRGIEEQCGKQGSKLLDDIASRIVAIIADIQCPADEMKTWEERFNTFMEENVLQSTK